MRDRLAVRLQPDDPELRGRVVARADLPGTLTVLAIERDGEVCDVTLEEAAQWGGATTELFDAALANLLNRPVRFEHEVIGNHRVFTVEEANYGAACALALDRFPQCVGRFGTFVAVPVRSLTFLVACHDGDAFRFMNHLLVMVRAVAEKGAHGVSPLLYHFHGGRFEAIQSGVVLPPGLAAIIDETKGSAAGGRVETEKFDIVVEPGWVVGRSIGLVMHNDALPDAFFNILTLEVPPSPQTLMQVSLATSQGALLRPRVASHAVGRLAGAVCTYKESGQRVRSMGLGLSASTVLHCAFSAPEAMFETVRAAVDRMLATVTPNGAQAPFTAAQVTPPDDRPANVGRVVKWSLIGFAVLVLIVSITLDRNGSLWRPVPAPQAPIGAPTVSMWISDGDARAETVSPRSLVRVHLEYANLRPDRPLTLAIRRANHDELQPIPLATLKLEGSGDGVTPLDSVRLVPGLWEVTARIGRSVVGHVTFAVQ